MSRGECPNANPECPRYPDCFTDAHHEYGRPKNGYQKRLARLGCHIVQICRAEHDDIHNNPNRLFSTFPLPEPAQAKIEYERLKQWENQSGQEPGYGSS